MLLVDVELVDCSGDLGHDVVYFLTTNRTLKNHILLPSWTLVKIFLNPR